MAILGTNGVDYGNDFLYNLGGTPKPNFGNQYDPTPGLTNIQQDYGIFAPFGTTPGPVQQPTQPTQPTPNPSAGNNDVVSNGGTTPNVGDISGNMRWNGKDWEPAYGGFNSYEDMLKAQLDEAYKPAYERLNVIEADYKNKYPISQQEVTDDYNAALPILNKEEAARSADILGQRQKGQREEKSQIGQARQLYGELSQSGLTRYGGSSSTGQAYSELLGQSTSKQFADVESKFGDYFQSLDKEQSTTNQYYMDKRTNLGNEKNTALKKLKAEYENSLKQIDLQKMTLDSQKAAQRIDAIKDYSLQVQKQQAEFAQWEAQLDSWKQYKDSILSEAKSKAYKSFSLPSFTSQMGGFGGVDFTAQTAKATGTAGGAYSGTAAKAGISDDDYNKLKALGWGDSEILSAFGKK